MKHCLYLLLCIAVRQCYERAVEMDNLRGLLGIRRMDIVPNAWIRELCRVMKGVDKRIDESVLYWFRNVERMGNDGFAKRVYAGECAGSRLVGC